MFMMTDRKASHELSQNNMVEYPKNENREQDMTCMLGSSELAYMKEEFERRHSQFLLHVCI